MAAAGAAQRGAAGGTPPAMPPLVLPHAVVARQRERILAEAAAELDAFLEHPDSADAYNELSAVVPPCAVVVALQETGLSASEFLFWLGAHLRGDWPGLPAARLRDDRADMHAVCFVDADTPILDQQMWAIHDLMVALAVETEHGPKLCGTTAGMPTDVTDGRLDLTMKIVLAHLWERPDYYRALAYIETSAPRPGEPPTDGARLGQVRKGEGELARWHREMRRAYSLGRGYAPAEEEEGGAVAH